jgi:hypothetical protein
LGADASSVEIATSPTQNEALPESRYNDGMLPQSQKSQVSNFVYGMLFGELAGVAVYGVTQWVPAIALGMQLGLIVGIIASVVQSRHK